MDPIFLAEAALNGVLLAGVLALLALGLNLIFGVLDIIWIAYVDLVTVGMYAVYFLVTDYGWPLWAAGLAAVGLGGLLGIAVHLLIISPILGSPPVNQLLATGGEIQTVEFAKFAADGRTIVFKSRDSEGRTGFWSIPVSGGAPRLVARLDNAHSSSAPYWDMWQGRIAFVAFDAQSDIVVMETHTGGH